MDTWGLSTRAMPSGVALLSFPARDSVSHPHKKGVSMSRRYSSKELATKLTAHIEELAEVTDAARMSEALLAYLYMCAKFDHFSCQNVWLILIDCLYVMFGS
jgi:hypothetical protein